MFEMVGDFDTGRDPFEGAQRDAALRVIGLVQERFGLADHSLKFHNQMSSKSCPGSAIDYEATIGAVRAIRSPSRSQPESVGRAELDDRPSGAIDDLLLGMVRDEAMMIASAGSGAAAETASTQARVPIETLESLRAHVINLSRGRFSTRGAYRTTTQDVDAIFGEDLERAVQGRDRHNPLRIVIWAHGGLVDEASGLRIAEKHVGWWRANDVFPLYFVWESGLLEALGRIITGRSGGPESRLTDRLSDFTDRQIEALARLVDASAIWSDMKQSARLAVDPNEGGGTYVAKKLSAFCARHGDAVELHAVGHSAGAIFHASLLPAALDQGAPGFRSLTLLAPAIRVDRFNERLAPLIGAGRGIERLAVFTMNKLRELDDTCLGVYRKSLLYLIHHALEEEREAPLLGLEVSLRADAALRAMFNLGDEHHGPGEIIWSKSPPGAPPTSRSASLTHGGFDDDPATMDSLLRRVTGRDDIRVGYASAYAAAAEGVPGSSAQPAPPPTDVVRGSPGSESASEPEADEFGVPFDVLDAFERAASLELNGAELGEAVVEEAALIETGALVAFGPNARAADVTAFSRTVLEEIMRAAGLSRVVVSSTSRNASEQARVMFANLISYGPEHQRRLYGPAGDRVIAIYEREKRAGRDATQIKASMTAEILAVGPSKVSRHASDPRILNVFDVAPSSIARKQAFVQAVLADHRVAKFLQPPSDPGYHLEIPQPAKRNG